MAEIMPERRGRSNPTNTTPWACNECKRRKGKCSGESPCQFCEKSNRRCIYEARPTRIPLTRQNLDKLQLRCAKLEHLLRTIDPNVDIERSLSTDRYTATNSTTSEHNNAMRVMEFYYQDMRRCDDEEEEAPPESACGFEWRESEGDKLRGGAGSGGGDAMVVGLSDGMASLNVDARDVGYLGTSSGAALLRTIQRLVTRYYQGSLLPETIPTSPPPNVDITHRLNSSFARQSLVDSYFYLYHPSYPLIHEKTFRSRYAVFSEVLSAPQWKLLYYMVLTMGAFCSYAGSPDEDQGLDLQIWNTVRKELSTIGILELGTLEQIQTLALMGQFLQKRDRPNTGYNMMGVAIRMALGLGLHRDFTEKTPLTANTLSREMRRRIWWVIYCFDVGSSITFGRPTIMSDRVETRVPLNINEGDLEAPESPLPRPITSCTTYSAIIAHCEFVKLANQIHSSFFTFRGLRPSRDLIRSLDERMLAWQKSLPAYFNADAEAPTWFAEPKAVIVWKGLNFRMLMHKCFLPLLKSPAVKAEAIEGIAPTKSGAGVCLFLAIQTIHSVHAFICSQTLRRGAAWYCTYFAFQAALVLVIAILTVDETPPPAIWTGNILMAEECLAATSRCLGDGASRYLEVLQRVMSIWGTRARPSAPSSPSPTGSFSVYAIGEGPSNTSLLADCANGLGFGELGPMPVDSAEVPDDYGLSSWMPTAQDFLEGSIEGFVMGRADATG